MMQHENVPVYPCDASPTRARSNGARSGKERPLTRDALDGRTKARKLFDAIAKGIAADLGGEGQLSTVQLHLIEAFAGVAINVQDLNARMLIGEPINVVEQAHAISTLARVASRIGINRVARDISPTLSDIMRETEDAAP
jgi:hypothetical protein